MHKTTVIRILGSHYEARCEECGVIARSQTQKQVMLNKAAEHDLGGTVTAPRVKATTRREEKVSTEEKEPTITAEPKQKGHYWEKAGICATCGGPLGRSYHQAFVERSEDDYEIISFCTGCRDDFNRRLVEARASKENAKASSGVSS